MMRIYLQILYVEHMQVESDDSFQDGSKSFQPQSAVVLKSARAFEMISFKW